MELTTENAENYVFYYLETHKDIRTIRVTHSYTYYGYNSGIAEEYKDAEENLGDFIKHIKANDAYVYEEMLPPVVHLTEQARSQMKFEAWLALENESLREGSCKRLDFTDLKEDTPDGYYISKII